MIARFHTGPGIALGLLLAAPALAGNGTAQSPDGTEAAQLRNELQLLRAQFDALQAKFDARQGRVENATTASGQPAGTAPADRGSVHETSIAWKGAPVFASTDGWSFKPRGRLQYDIGYVDAPAAIDNDGLGFSSELRRIRLGAEGSIPGGFDYRVELEFAGGDAQLWDGYIRYTTGNLGLTVGQHNNFQSLEELASANDTVFLERAAFTDAFGFERRLGLSAQYRNGPVLVQAGVFTDNVADLDDDGNNAVGVDGRVVFAPRLGSTQLHLGASAHWRRLSDTDPTARYRQRPHIHSTDIRFIDTGNIADTDAETGYGIEALAIAGRFHATGEAYWQKLSRTASPSPGFFGGYAEIGYFLTDSSYGYRNGVLRAPVLKHPVQDGGTGAVALALRYDHLDLVDRAAGVIGGRQDAVIAGVSWWPTENLRILLNHAHLWIHDAAIPAAEQRNYRVRTIGGRIQLGF